MKKMVTLPLLLVLLYTGYSQSIDRFVFSNAYGGSDAIGEWVLGEALVGDFTGPGVTLYNGFLQTELVTTHVQSRRHPDFLFNAYPNPTDGLLHLAHSSPQPLEVVIFDMMGRPQVYRNKVGVAEAIDLYSLPPGAYTLRYSSGSSNCGAILILKTR